MNTSVTDVSTVAIPQTYGEVIHQVDSSDESSHPADSIINEEADIIQRYTSKY